MFELKQAIADVPDFPRPGILFRDISPLLRDHFDAAIRALDALLTDAEWSEIDALAGIESRGLMLIDDVLATGGTMTAAADLCLRAGYQVQALVALIDLNIVVNYSWRTLRLRSAINYQP